MKISAFVGWAAAFSARRCPRSAPSRTNSRAWLGAAVIYGGMGLPTPPMLWLLACAAAPSEPESDPVEETACEAPDSDTAAALDARAEMVLVDGLGAHVNP